MDGLAQQGWVSDSRFAEEFVRDRLSRGFGPLRIRAELKERGVSEDLAASWLEEDAVDWYAQAERTRCKRFGTELPAGLRERARQARFLQYRGFSSEQIRAVLAGGD